MAYMVDRLVEVVKDREVTLSALVELDGKKPHTEYQLERRQRLIVAILAQNKVVSELVNALTDLEDSQYE